MLGLIRRTMVPAIKFDNELMLVAEKIHKVRSNGHLPPKVNTVELLLAKMFPELSFSICCVSSEVS